jgi:pimeloyl-ACP methyl ester carboxylesterase
VERDPAVIHDFFYESTDGLKLYCAVYSAQRAAGLPVLCLPGLTRNSRDFAGLAARLSRQHDLLAADLRGRGRSAWDTEPAHYELPTYVRDTWTLLDRCRIDRFVAIGTSLGGLMAMTMAAMDPRRVAGVILNDIGPEIDPAGVRRIAGYVGRLPPVRDWNEAIAQTKSVYGPALPGLSDAEWARYARCGYRENEVGVPVLDVDPGIATNFNRPGAGTPDLWPLFKRVTVPMLVIRGGLSDILSRDTLTRMIREKPDLSQVTLAQRGHAPLLDEPECLQAIDLFLTRYGFTDVT